MKENKDTFESKLKKLEDIVAELEAENVSVDNSVKLFEEGSILAAELAKKLKDVKGKIEVLKEKQGELFAETFEPEK